MGSTNVGDLYKDKFRENQLYNKEKTDLSIHQQAFVAGGKQKLVYVMLNLGNILSSSIWNNLKIRFTILETNKAT